MSKDLVFNEKALTTRDRMIDAACRVLTGGRLAHQVNAATRNRAVELVERMLDAMQPLADAVLEEGARAIDSRVAIMGSITHHDALACAWAQMLAAIRMDRAG